MKISKLLLMGLLFGHSICSFADPSWLVRLRAIDVIPETSSSTISVIGGEVTHISNAVVPELDFSYFFTPHIAAELILATSHHSVEATNTSIGTVDLGKVWVLPPTLTLQYHFLPNQFFSPYAGVGINYTHFYRITNGPGLSSTRYSDSWGAALQLGVDFIINDNWSINIDAKQIFMSSDVTLNSGPVRLGTTERLNPLVLGLGVGYRFC